MQGKKLAALLAAVITVAGAGALAHQYLTRYTVQVVVPSAAQLTEGSPVMIMQREVGNVSALTARDGRAVVTLRMSGPDVPLHEGTTSSVDWSAVLGERFLTLYPGPAANATIPSGGLLDAPSRQIEVDQVLATLDAPTRARLDSLVHGLNNTVDGAEPDLRATLQTAGPTIAALGQVMDAAGKDGPAIQNLASELDRMTAVLADRQDRVRSIVSNLAGFTTTAAGAQQQLADGLGQMPETLRVTRGALDRVPPAAKETVPLLTDLKPATDQLPQLADDLRPLMKAAGPVTDRLRPVLDGLNNTLDAAPRLLDSAHDTMPPLADTFHDYRPAMAFLRPYTPEFVGFAMNWGSTFSTYDSQGHVWAGLITPGPDAFNDGVAHLPGQVARPEPKPGEVVGQPWVDATGNGMR